MITETPLDDSHLLNILAENAHNNMYNHKIKCYLYKSSSPFFNQDPKPTKSHFWCPLKYKHKFNSQRPRISSSRCSISSAPCLADPKKNKKRRNTTRESSTDGELASRVQQAPSRSVICKNLCMQKEQPSERV